MSKDRIGPLRIFLSFLYAVVLGGRTCFLSEHSMLSSAKLDLHVSKTFFLIFLGLKPGDVTFSDGHEQEDAQDTDLVKSFDFMDLTGLSPLDNALHFSGSIGDK